MALVTGVQQTIWRYPGYDRPPPPQDPYSEILSKLIPGPYEKSRSSPSTSPPSQTELRIEDRPEAKQNSPVPDHSNSTTTSTVSSVGGNVQSQPSPPQAIPRRSCRAPLSRRFAHPCTCTQSKEPRNLNSNSTSNNGRENSFFRPLIPPPAYTSPLHLYDPVSKKCLPTSRSNDMLLKDCHNHGFNHQFAVKSQHGLPCGYEDLICDGRRFKCICKPPLHLFYQSTNTSNGLHQTTFGCVPMGPTSSPDGKMNCRPGQVYNSISRECQKIFDVHELPNYPSGVSATQFSFVTIVLIWILLLILIVTAKLRKLRSSNMYRNTPTGERRPHSGSSSLHHHNHPRTTSTWLHPFIAAVNGHHHLNQHRRHSQPMDGAENYNDTDFFLHNGTRRINDMLADHNLTSSQQSLNNPPPKFEEIYSNCQDEGAEVRLPSTEDLPTYDEAMKLQNTMPPDPRE